MLRKSCYKLRVTVLIRAIVRGTRLCPTCAIYSFLLLRHLGGSSSRRGNPPVFAGELSMAGLRSSDYRGA